MSSALAQLRRKGRISFIGRVWQLCGLNRESILEALEDGALSTRKLLAALGQKGGVDADQADDMLRELKRSGRIVRSGHKWSLPPELSEAAVLERAADDGGVDPDRLIRLFGLAGDRHGQKELQQLLKRLERSGRLRFHHGMYHAAESPRASRRSGHGAERDKWDEASPIEAPGLDEAFPEQTDAATGAEFPWRPSHPSADGPVEGVYCCEHGLAFVRIGDENGPGQRLAVRRRTFPLVCGDCVRVTVCEPAGPGSPAECIVDEVTASSTRPLTLEIGGMKNSWYGTPRGPFPKPARPRARSAAREFCRFFLIEKGCGPLRPSDIVEAVITRRDAHSIWVKVLQRRPALSSIADQESLTRINHQAPGGFPDDVLRETAALSGDLSPDVTDSRADLRELPFVTMDGASARDFDDAVCVERVSGGGWLLRVAIADVSHYVKPGTPLDREALARGNSWYFPTSVAPMLPERLSNDLCSLVPDRDRLVVWAAMDFSPSGRMRRTSFGTGIMRSAARLTYDGAKSLALDRDETALAAFAGANPRASEILSMLDAALELYRVLAKVRRDRGSLDFDLPEPEAEFDGQGHITGLFRADRHDMHRLVEEFMIAANEAVAVFLGKSEIPFLYRVHPAPEGDKLEMFRRQLASCGLMPKGRAPDSMNLPELLRGFAGTPGEYVFNRLCVRTMSQARYSGNNIGHYGLASEAYCHFTSPIRRYADLLVHRALKLALGLGPGPVPSGRRLERVADIINTQERAAIECEREMNKRIACMWMSRQPRGTVWKATVSSVQPFGVFVELDDVPVEGLVHVRDLGNHGWMEYDPFHDCLTDEFSGRSIAVGTHLEVSLSSLDPVTLYINFRTSRLEQYRPSEGGRRKKSGAAREGRHKKHR
ncbi:MAG: VacB/RNase II family 3'-5' exoribonuclease [Desulfovibrionaceae bacterium]|nr:VacB/RNase II family 3'-5' exoribonuclease [Desulfovibrionaceae bacterium]